MRSRPWVLGSLCALVAALACVALSPAVVNGDGLGYLKAAPTGIVVPGHLGYLPLLRAVGRLVGQGDSLGLLGPSRWVSILSCAVAAAALYGAARRLVDAAGALVAALGCAVSFAAVQAGGDVETYAPALAALCLVAYAAVRRRAGGGVFWLVATAVSVAAATLLHIENALVAPAAALLAAGAAAPPSTSGATHAPAPRWRPSDALVVLLGSGGLCLAAYLAAFHARGDDARSAVHWVANASHGFSYPLRWSTPLVAVYGMAKTLVYAPYPHQASWARVIGQTLCGVVGLGAMLWLVRRPSRPATLGTLVGAAWIVPYALVGVAFFASDNERWIFLLPPAWLAVGAGALADGRARRVAIGLVAALAIGDLAFGLPLARDASIRDNADRLASLIQPEDLVVSPGHSWDEYLGFYAGRSLDRFPMIYFCGLLGGADAAKKELAIRVQQARARHARVFFARLDEPETADGWKELVLFGVTPANAPSFLPPGRLVPVAPGLLRLDP